MIKKSENYIHTRPVTFSLHKIESSGGVIFKLPKVIAVGAIRSVD